MRVAVSVPLNVTDSQVSCRIDGNVTKQLAKQEKGVVVFGDKLEDDEEDRDFDEDESGMVVPLGNEDVELAELAFAFC